MNKKNAGPFAWLTLLLVGVQLAVFAAAWWGSPPRALFDSLPASALLRWGGNFAPATMEGEWWRLAAHRFIQTDLISLLVVATAFWSAGGTAERIFGRAGLAIVFFGTSIATGLASLAFNSSSGVAVGAGAVVLGIFAALASHAIAVRSPSPWLYLRPMRYTGPVFLGRWVTLRTARSTSPPVRRRC